MREEMASLGLLEPEFREDGFSSIAPREGGCADARREYVAVTGVAERTAANDLADLVRKGLLESTGGRGRRTAYRLRDDEG